MDFNIEELLRLAEEISVKKEINLIDIPFIDLYMDQVTTLFEDKLSHLKRETGEPILTKTMINNYAKAKILTPIKNKKYNKQQIITLILIYNLKQILSLDDIKALFAPFVDRQLESSEKLPAMEDLYSKFLSIKEHHNSEFTEYLSKNIELINDLNRTEGDVEAGVSHLFLTVLTLINSANLQKRLAERLIDEYFSSSETQKNKKVISPEGHSPVKKEQ